MMQGRCALPRPFASAVADVAALSLSHSGGKPIRPFPSSLLPRNEMGQVEEENAYKG